MDKVDRGRGEGTLLEKENFLVVRKVKRKKDVEQWR
jgi:hypothetical protein